MPEPMVSPTAFARAAGVAQSSIVQAIKEGRLQAYSKSGRRLSAGSKGPKRLKLDEARQSFDESRVRLNTSFLTKGSEKSGPPRRDLLTARTRTASLQGELLEMRLAREQGDVIPRAAAAAAIESLGRAIQRAHKAIPGWAEEITGAAQTGGVAAVRAVLEAKRDELDKAVDSLVVATIAEILADED